MLNTSIHVDALMIQKEIFLDAVMFIFCGDSQNEATELLLYESQKKSLLINY